MPRNGFSGNSCCHARNCCEGRQLGVTLVLLCCVRPGCRVNQQRCDIVVMISLIKNCKSIYPCMHPGVLKRKAKIRIQYDDSPNFECVNGTSPSDVYELIPHMNLEWSWHLEPWKRNASCPGHNESISETFCFNSSDLIQDAIRFQ